MKKCVFLLASIFLLLPIVFGQKDNRKVDLNPSISVTFSPSFFSAPNIGVKSSTFCPNSWTVKGSLFLFKRVSLSTGLNLLSKNTIEEYSSYAEFGYRGPVKLDHNLKSLSIPLVMNIYLTKPESKPSLYLKIDFRNTYKFVRTEGSPNINGIFGTDKVTGYSNSMGFGCGINYRAFEKLSFVLEPCIHYYISGYLPLYSLMELQLGINFNI